MPGRPELVYVGLGANLGGRRGTLDAAVAALQATPRCTVRRVSSFRETAAVGPIADQPPYLNGVVELVTTLGPCACLRALLSIERRYGRNRALERRWGPRTLDLDILLYADLVLEQPGLVVPHPRLHERRFMLEPLAELIPDAVHPVLRETIASLKSRVSGECGHPETC